jgi:parvulin-like peptidyl-prolyl isomerase
MSKLAQSRLTKQKKQKKVTLWASVGVVALVAVILLTGFITKQLIPVIIPLHKTVLTVNGVEYNAQYIARLVNYFTGGDPTYAYLYIDYAIETAKQDQLIKEGAAKLGITVSDDEVKSYLETAKLDDNQTTRDIAYASLLYKKLTDQKFKPEVGSSGPQRQAYVMLLESAAQAEAVKARLAAGESFADITKALSLDPTTVTDKGDIGFHPQGIIDGLLTATGLDDKIFSGSVNDLSYFYDETKSKQLGYWIIKLNDRTTTNGVQTAKASGILLPTIEKAQDILQKLNAGGDFATLAKENSQDSATKDSGGDLGTLTAGTSTGVYISFVFDAGTQIGQISQAVQTKDASTTGAYWLYQVVAAQPNRDFTTEDQTTLVNKAFSDWAKALSDDPSNVIDQVTLTEAQRDLIATESEKS